MDTRERLTQELTEAAERYIQAKREGKIPEYTATREDYVRVAKDLQDAFVRKSKELNKKQNQI